MAPSSARRRVRALAPAFVVTVFAAVGGCDDESVDPPMGGAAAAAANAGAAGAGSNAAGGATGGGGATSACPSPEPLMNDPCEGDTVCTSRAGSCSALLASCKGGRWKLDERGASGGGCNPPPPCPDAEPGDADLDNCGKPQFFGWSHQLCRYPRASCFIYLDCPSIYHGGNIPWRAGPYGSPLPADACCPATEPAPGDACTEEGILCGWEKAPAEEYDSPLGASFVRELVCRNGVWGPRLNPVTFCPAELPGEKEPCGRGTPCTGYPDPDNDPCKTVTATCVGRKWQHSFVSVDGCPPAP